MTIPSFDESPPDEEALTSYDERHLVTYLRLLDAERAGTDWRDVARIVFGLDPGGDPGRARLVHDSHLARAHWMSEKGYRHLLGRPAN